MSTPSGALRGYNAKAGGAENQVRHWQLQGMVSVRRETRELGFREPRGREERGPERELTVNGSAAGPGHGDTAEMNP